VAPGPRVFDPTDATTALHQRYHDGTIQYTMDNMEWLQNKGHSRTSEPTQEDHAAARERLFRWPTLQPRDTERLHFGGGPQRFSSEPVAGDPGDNIFVVSLPRRPEKRANAIRQLRDTGLNATLVTACDGDAVLCQADLPAIGVQVMPNYRGHVNHDMPFTTGEVGCFMSHFATWQHMVDNQLPAALILEDDFELQENFADRLGDCLRQAQGEDWNIMYVGRSPMENDVRKISEHVAEPGYTLWTVAYILTLDGARALLESRAEQHMVPLDDFFSVAMGCGMDGQYNDRAVEWSRLIGPVLRGVALHPPLVMPYVGSMFLSDTAMMRKGTRYMRDLPMEPPDAAAAAHVGAAAAMPGEWREALARLQAFLHPSSMPAASSDGEAASFDPSTRPRRTVPSARLPPAPPPPLQEPEAVALGRRYFVAGSWDGWQDFVELVRVDSDEPWYEGIVRIPKGRDAELQVICDSRWDLRCFPMPGNSGIAGPSRDGHGFNWLVSGSGAQSEGGSSELRVRWKPTGPRELSWEWARR